MNPYIPQWSVGIMKNQGAILSADGFLLHVDEINFQLFLKIIKGTTAEEITDVNNTIVLVEPLKSSVLLTKQYDELYPLGIELPIDEMTSKFK